MNEKHRILYVDDEPSNLTVFRSTRRTFRCCGGIEEKGLRSFTGRRISRAILINVCRDERQMLPRRDGFNRMPSHDSHRLYGCDKSLLRNEGHIYRFHQTWAEAELSHADAPPNLFQRLNQKLTEELIRAERNVGKMASAMGHEIPIN